MMVIPYRITLLEPLLATRLAGDPNSSVSYPYVPGSMVRGAVVAAYLHDKQAAALDAGAATAQRLFFDGRTRYLNGYPVTSDGSRTLPTPRTWFAVKGDTSNAIYTIYDSALAALTEIEDERKQFEAVASESRPFCQIDDEQVFIVAPKRRVNVHTQRDRIKGKATQEKGAVFQYDALDQDQTFAGWVLVDNDQDAELLAALLPKVYRIGGSSNSGYGRVHVEVDAPMQSANLSWSETVNAPTTIEAGDVFIITLLSDVITRDSDTGQSTWNLLPSLQEKLGAHIQAFEPAPGDAQDDLRSVWRMEEVGGFNRTWGLPLPQAQAIAAGSVYIFQAVENIDAEAIAALEWSGLGERRSEGFGRLAINWQTREELTKHEQQKRPTTITEPTLDGAAQAMANQMVRRMLRQELDAKLRKKINDTKSENLAISNAQLSRLRVVARDALPQGDVKRLQVYLGNVKERRSVKQQFERTRINGFRLIHWLEELLNKPTAVWEQIGATNLNRRLGANVQFGAGNDGALANEYTLRLIDGVLSKLAKKRTQEEVVNHD